MTRPRKARHTLPGLASLVAIGIVILALSGACIGGGEETPAPTSRPATLTPNPTTPTSTPTEAGSPTSTATAPRASVTVSPGTPPATLTSALEPETSTPTPTESPASTPEPTHSPTVTPATPQKRVTALLLGLDRRPTEPDHNYNRTDVIELVTFDPKTGKSAMIGFPRDTYVEIPGHGKDRINTAYFWASYPNRDYKAALANVERTFETNFGVKVDFSIATDFASFLKVAQDIGGVQIELPPALDGYIVSAPAPGGVTIRLRQGKQVAAAEYLLAAARARPDGDLNRVERARSILTGVYDKLRGMSLFDLTALFLKHAGDVETDLSPDDWPALISLAEQVDPSQIEFHSVGDYVSFYTTPQGASVLLPNFEAIHTMLKGVFGDDLAD